MGTVYRILIFFNLLSIGYCGTRQDNLPQTTCVRLFRGRNYQGATTDLQATSTKTSLGNWAKIPQSAVVKNGCRLTAIDEEVKHTNFENEIYCLWKWNNRIVEACCECGGCEKIELTGRNCAKLFWHSKCSSCNRKELTMNSRDNLKSLGESLGAISSISVRSGCTITIYEKEKMQGKSTIYTSSVNQLPSDWDNKVSSAKCSCSDSISDYDDENSVPGV